jgi:hypothetical protein
VTSAGEFHVDFLRGVLAKGGRIVAARFSLQRGLLKQIEPRFFLTLEQGGVQSLQELPWTPDLEKYLLLQLHQKVSAPNEETPDEEAERFAAILLNNLETAGRDFGRDFAQAVLVEILKSRPEYKLEAWLAEAPTYSPSHSSRAYADCSSFLRQSVDGLKSTAHLELGYTLDASASLVSKALSILLDEIFHISARKALFPK